jgi:hypothetical protein
LLTLRKGEEKYYGKIRLYCMYIQDQKKSINKEQKQKGVQDWYSLIANLRGSVKVYT